MIVIEAVVPRTRGQTSCGTKVDVEPSIYLRSRRIKIGLGQLVRKRGTVPRVWEWKVGEVPENADCACRSERARGCSTRERSPTGLDRNRRHAIKRRAPNTRGKLKRNQALLAHRRAAIAAHRGNRSWVIEANIRLVIVLDYDVGASKRSGSRNEYQRNHKHCARKSY
jgi:hypothetical protein